MNLREALTAASQPAPRKIEVAGIEAEVFIRTLTVGEIIGQQEDMKDGANKPAIARALARVLVDANNQPVYNGNTQDDINAILALPWPFVKAIMEQANKLNGVASEDAVVKN